MSGDGRMALRAELRNAGDVTGTEFDGGPYLPKFVKKGQMVVLNWEE